MLRTLKNIVGKIKVVKKFPQLYLLVSAGVALVVAGIVLTFGAKVTSEVASEMTSGTVARDAADNGTAGIGKLAKYLPLIGLVIAASVIIMLVLAAFGSFGRRR